MSTAQLCAQDLEADSTASGRPTRQIMRTIERIQELVQRRHTVEVLLSNPNGDLIHGEHDADIYMVDADVFQLVDTVSLGRAKPGAEGRYTTSLTPAARQQWAVLTKELAGVGLTLEEAQGRSLEEGYHKKYLVRPR